MASINRYFFLLTLFLIPSAGWGKDISADSPQTLEEYIALPEEQIDPARAALLLVKEASPEIDIESYLQRVDAMAEELRPRLEGDLSLTAKLEAIGRYIFKEKGFHIGGGNEGNIHFESMLDKKEGNCYRFSFLYLALGWRLKIPFQKIFVYYPDHALIRYDDGKEVRYIETTSNGVVLTDLNHLGGSPYIALKPRQTTSTLWMQEGTSAYVQRNDKEKALEAFSKTLKFFPDFPPTLIYMGIVLDKMGKSEEGIASIRKAIKLCPHYAIAYYNLGCIYIACEKWDDALEAFLTALNEKPDFKAVLKIFPTTPNYAMVLNNLGIVYEKKNDFEKAFYYFQKAYELDPQLLEASSNLIKIYIKFGVDNLQKKNGQDALADFQKALGLSPNLSWIHSFIGHAYIALNETENAIFHFRQALESDPKTAGPPFHQAITYQSLGDIYLRLEKWDDAQEAYLKAIEKNPNLALAYCHLGMIYDKKKDRDKALWYFQKALELDPKMPDLSRNLAIFYLNWGLEFCKEEKWDEAEEKFLKVIEIDSYNANAYNSLGGVYIKKSEYEKALSHLHKAIDLNTRHREAYNNLAVLLLQMDKYEEAWQIAEDCAEWGKPLPEEIKQEIRRVLGAKADGL
ncbi:MAG: tetratricopeptide repeat protein [Candidatus Omnitrophota bacterium]